MAQLHTISLQVFDLASLAIKDSLRGLRHISLYLRSLGNQAISAFPNFLRRPSKSVVRRVDNIAEHVERKTATVVHRYLDPDITRDSKMATFVKIERRKDAARIFAKTTYDNLKLTLAYLTPRFELKEEFFISEMLSACAYRKANIDKLTDVDEYHRAAAVLLQLGKQGVIRTHRSLNAIRSQDEDIRKLVEVSYFAHMLWLLIARDYESEREYHLLHACCDLSSVIHEQIREAGSDIDKLSDLLRMHAEMV